MASPPIIDQLKELTINGVITDQSEEIGRGAYGKVFTVKYLGLPCAAKEIHASLIHGANPEEKKATRDRFIRECYQSSIIRHPHIVQCIGVYYPSEQSDLPIMVMELLDTNVSSFVENNKSKIAVNTKMSILHDVSLGLSYLHGRDPPVVHRDLTSNNVLLTSHLIAKIGDLGMAKMIRADSTKKRSRLTTAPGNPHFMPPEALDEDDPIYGTPVDVFSFAGIALHLFSEEWPTPSGAKKPDPNTNEVVSLTEVQRRQKYLDKMVGGAATRALRETIVQCLHDHPNKRPLIQEVSKKIEPLKSSQSDIQKLTNQLERATVTFNNLADPTKDKAAITSTTEQSNSTASRSGKLGFLECIIIESHGGLYNDAIKAVPMEKLTPPSTDSSTSSHKHDDLDVKQLVQMDHNKELICNLHDSVNSQKSKQYYLDSIENVFKECTRDGVWIYYTGYAEEGTGNWCFRNGTVCFQEIMTLYRKYLIGKLLYLVIDCCYAGQWVLEYAKHLDEMGIAACGHQTGKHGMLLKIFASCYPDEKATVQKFCDDKWLVFHENDHTLAYYTNKKVSDTQNTLGVDFTNVNCFQFKGSEASCLMPKIPANCRWKWVDMLSKHNDTRPSEHKYLIRGKDEGRDAWYIVLVQGVLLKLFREKLAATEIIDLTEYGYVITSDWGKDPPKEILDKVFAYGPW